MLSTEIAREKRLTNWQSKTLSRNIGQGRRMTLKTVRIVVVGGEDTGKTAFIESLGAVAMGGSITGEKSVTFKSGDDLVKFEFVELPSDKFKKFFTENSTTLPVEFNSGQGVAMLFSYADHRSREPCNYWLNFLSAQEQGDGLKPALVVVGNKADLIEAESPQAHFVSNFHSAGLIDVDSCIMSEDHHLRLSPMRVLVRFNEMMWPRENINSLVPVASAPPVGILIPTEASQMFLKPIVLHVGQTIGLGRKEVHTGYAVTKNALALMKSISRQHIEVVHQPDGTTSLVNLSDCPVSILNSNGRCIQVLRTKNRGGVFVPVKGRINLNNATDQATYKVVSFDSFMSGGYTDTTDPLSVLSLLQEQDKIYKQRFKLLEAELARISHEVEILELAVTESGAANSGLEQIDEELLQLSVTADDDSYDSAGDIFGEETQAY
jgi:hypothetical protein